MFEKDLPGHNTTGFGGASVSALPLETCETINDSWGFNITDRNYKSAKELIHYLVRAAGYGSNFLLNIGPMPNGSIQPEFVERLEAMGGWLKTNGATIYGSRGGWMTPKPWGAVTEKGNTVFLHLLNDPGEKKLFLQTPFKVKSARERVNGRPVKINSLSDNYVMIDLNGLEMQEYDTIIEMEVVR
mgnify:FL=1